jgi:hypothetical protein
MVHLPISSFQSLLMKPAIVLASGILIVWTGAIAAVDKLPAKVQVRL